MLSYCWLPGGSSHRRQGYGGQARVKVNLHTGGSSRVPCVALAKHGVSRDRDLWRNKFLLQASPLIVHHPSIHFASHQDATQNTQDDPPSVLTLDF